MNPIRMRIGIVGGGVIGLFTAWYLKKLGADPVLIDASMLGGGCSFGNTGWVFPSLATPLPAPGLTLKSFVWMLRRDSPLHIRPAALPALAPWLLRFRSFCNGADQKRGIAALAALNEFTIERYDELAADGVRFEYSESGLLMAFRDADMAAASRKEVKLAAAAGLRLRLPQRSVGTESWSELDEAALYEREPLLRPGFRFGLALENDRHVRPESLTAGLGSALRERGVEIHEGVAASGFRSEGHRVTAIVTSMGRPRRRCRGAGGRRSHRVPESHAGLAPSSHSRQGLLDHDRAAREAAPPTALSRRHQDRFVPIRRRVACCRNDGAVGNQQSIGPRKNPVAAPPGEPRRRHPRGERWRTGLGGHAPHRPRQPAGDR